MHKRRSPRNLLRTTCSSLTQWWGPVVRVDDSLAMMHECSVGKVRLALTVALECPSATTMTASRTNTPRLHSGKNCSRSVARPRLRKLARRVCLLRESRPVTYVTIEYKATSRAASKKVENARLDLSGKLRGSAGRKPSGLTPLG